MNVRNYLSGITILLLLSLAVAGRIFAGPGEPEPNTRGIAEPVREISVRSHPTNADLAIASAAAARFTLPDERCLVRGMARLGLAWSGPSTRFGTGFTTEAAYFVGTDTIQIVRGEVYNIRHETIHALHDQYGDLAARFETATSVDEIVALHTLSEGVSSALSRDGSSSFEPVATVPSTLTYLARNAGPRYVYQFSGGNPLAAFTLAPATTHEIVYGTVADLVTIPPPVTLEGERVLCTTRLGFTYLYTALRQSGASHDSAIDHLASWRGDQMSVIEGVSGERVDWVTVFGSREDARAWRVGPSTYIPLTRARTSLPVHTVTN